MKKYFYLAFLLFLLTGCGWSEQDVNGTDKPVNQIKSSKGVPVIQSASPQDPGPHRSQNKVKKNKRYRYSSVQQFIKPSIRQDSLRIAKLRSLRAAKIGIDLNEPVSKDYLLSSVNNGKFASMITLSQEKFLKINFDNDILNYTDRFYTNGIRFDFISPVFQLFPLCKLLVPYWRGGMNYYGIALVQNLYTPSTTKVDGILFGDRPYAAYLYFGTYKITNDPVSQFRQKSEIDIGVIGPASFGEYVQKSFHSEVPTNSVPLGWEYQIKNDLVLNYSYSVEKGVLDKENLDFSINGSGTFGTLYTNLSGGFLMRAGIRNPYFVNLGQSKRRINRENGLKNTQFFFFITSRGKVIGYDATLQGGFFNKSSVYNVSGDKISRVVYEGSAGITFVYGGFRVDVEQFLLSPEFKNGWWHKWIHMAFTFSL